MSIADIELFLAENSSRKVSSISEDLLAMVAKLSIPKSNGTGKNFIKDAEGNVIAVFCYYHKTWELVEHIPYGKKASNASTGLNTMCKEGTSNWTKQQKAFKKGESDLLTKLAAGEVDVSDLSALKQDLEDAKQTIVPNSMLEYCFDDVADIPKVQRLEVYNSYVSAYIPIIVYIYNTNNT